MRTVLVTVDAEQPEEAVVLFECDDAQAMRRHFASDALKEAHRKAGVVPGSNQASVLIPASVRLPPGRRPVGAPFPAGR
ncbi:hypothetical protein ACFQ0B_18100 [Nonomuraea thailandensis]